MTLTIQLLSSTATLNELTTVIEQSERLTWELISLTCGTVSGSASNIAVFRFRDTGPPLRSVAIEQVDGALSLDQQKAALSATEASGKRLICYSSVFVEGRQRNVAVFRE